jgi:hypothetical protein
MLLIIIYDYLRENADSEQKRESTPTPSMGSTDGQSQVAPSTPCPFIGSPSIAATSVSSEKLDGKESVSPTKTTEKKQIEVKPKALADASMATYLDVAVLRCLFTSQWLEGGIEWALNFLLNR